MFLCGEKLLCLTPGSPRLKISFNFVYLDILHIDNCEILLKYFECFEKCFTFYAGRIIFRPCLLNNAIFQPFVLIIYK